MATQVESEIALRPFDVDEYHRMVEAGILGEADRVELIEGRIVELEPISGRHRVAVVELNRFLARHLPDDLRVSTQNHLRLDRWSEPQPDLAVFCAEDLRSTVPGLDRALLVIEVAYSSLRYDRKVKLPLYARHGVPEYWIVDVGGELVERFEEPGEGGYARRFVARRGEVVESTAVPSISLRVDDVLD